MAHADESKTETSKELTKLVSDFKALRRAGAPLVAINTPDAGATIKAIISNVSDFNTKTKLPIGKMQWDICSGLVGLNDSGKDQITVKDELENIQFPDQFAKEIQLVDPNTIVFCHMASRFMECNTDESKAFVQGVWNLRDVFKRNGRTLVLLGHNVKLPPELQGDVAPLEQALPNVEELEAIIRRQYENAGCDVEEKKIDKAVGAVQGLPSFQAEQVTAVSLSKDGIDVDSLWERKRKQVEQTPGLSINREGVSFDDIGGLDSIKEFLKLYFKGKRRPTAIVFIDEIEKAMAGEGDMSGISQDQLGETLKFMQDKNSTGLMFVGHPGGGKSVLAKAVANEFGIPMICLDYGGLKASLVGDSETNLRNAFKVIDSVSGGNALFIATSNGIDRVKSELKRRFKLGTYFFDLPGTDEQKPIWSIHQKKFGLKKQSLPSHKGWTGAEIEQCCFLADAMDITLKKASSFIVPISISDSKQIEKLCGQANGKWQDATRGGVYKTRRNEQAQDSGARSVSLEDDE